MKLVFDGTPEQILKDMKEFIARSGFEFALDDSPLRKGKPDLPHGEDRIKVTMPEPPPVTIVEMPPKTVEGLTPCQFCKNLFQRINSHERRCPSNPNAVPDLRTRRKEVVDYIAGAYE